MLIIVPMMKTIMLMTSTRIMMIKRTALLLSPSFASILEEVAARPAHEWKSFKHISPDLSHPANKKHLPLACQTLHFTSLKLLNRGKPQPPYVPHMKPCMDASNQANLAWVFSHKNLIAQLWIVGQNGTCGLCFLPLCLRKVNCKVSFNGRLMGETFIVLI